MNNLQTDDAFQLARKARRLKLRADLLCAIRRFFSAHEFLEIDTPIRLPSPAPEEHIDAIATEDWFLQTSPELCMKRLLAAGYSRIFQICKCFRKGERGDRHLPEFTMLEWYVAGFDYRDLMDQCEALLKQVFSDLPGTTDLPFAFDASWDRITVEAAFAKYAPMTCDDAQKQGLFDELLVTHVEPHLGVERPLFLMDYPASMAALARTRPNDATVAERFELYISGMELANGFSELTDPAEQRRRFVAALAARASRHQPTYTLPEKFLNALQGMPPSAGIALGIDRLVMLLTGANRIDDVVAFPPEML